MQGHVSYVMYHRMMDDEQIDTIEATYYTYVKSSATANNKLRQLLACLLQILSDYKRHGSLRSPPLCHTLLNEVLYTS